jgi:CYTH domain-containing protein
MATEIERKFLLKSDAWKSVADGPGTVIRQGYLASGGKCTVRVRVKGEHAWVTIKGPTIRSSRPEFEYPIPVHDAAEMLDSLCGAPLIDKTRYTVKHGGVIFEIDEFHGENTGLTVAEVELESEDQAVDLPDWIGGEVTGDPRYYNSNLARSPYRQWGERA